MTAAPHTAGTLSQFFELARRSLLRASREPAQIVPALIFPLLILAINAGGLDAATDLPGFPANSYLTFALAVPFIQGGIFAVLNGGTDLARDIESGFFNRLALAPVPGTVLIAGQLAGVVVVGVLQAIFYVSAGLAAGASFAAGAAGLALLLALVLAIAFSFGCIGMLAGLRLGNSEAIQGLFPLFFVFLFLSSMALPRELIAAGWFRTIATWNPVSYLIEGVRSLFITGVDWGALGPAFAVTAVIAALFLALSAAALRTRLVRT